MSHIASETSSNEQLSPAQSRADDRGSESSSSSRSESPETWEPPGLLTTTNPKSRESTNDVQLMKYNPSKEGESTSKSKGKTESCDVCFHILVSPTLLANKNDGAVYIHFQTTALGGWESRQHPLKFIRSHTDGYLQYEGLVNISKDLLNSCLLYCYYVHIATKGNEVIKVKEYIYSHRSESNNRTLFVPREKVRDTIHQFDGVVKEKPENKKGMIKMVKGFLGVDDYKKELKKEAGFALRALAPQVRLSITEKSSITGEEILYYFDRLIDGLQTVYQVTAGLWYSGKSFLSSITEDIHEYIAEQLFRIQDHKKVQRPEDRILILSAAIALITIKDSNNVELTDVEDDCLCGALLPTLNEQRTCPEYEGLSDYFPKTKTVITSSLLCAVKKYARSTTKTCWLLCIPLLHFLLDKYKPYQLPTDKYNHREDNAEWWGIDGLKKEINDFKDKPRWLRRRNDLLKSLEPYFTFDFLLPRTFMACLRLHQVLETVELDLLPTDAILGTLYFYITTSYVNKDVWKGIEKTIIKLTTRLLSMSEDQELPIEFALRNFKIASDVTNKLYDINKFVNDKTIMCLLGAEVVFVAIAWYTKCLKRRPKEEKQGDHSEHMACFESHRDRVKNILCSEHFYRDEELLRVRNEKHMIFLNIMQHFLWKKKKNKSV